MNLKKLNLRNLGIKNYVMVAMGFIIVLLLLKLEYCRPVSVKYIDRTITDSIIRKSTVDTFYITNRTIKYVPVSYPELIKEYKDTCLDLQVNSYTIPVQDSLIIGKIVARVTGTLDSLKVDYTYKYPVISKTDSVTVYQIRTVFKQPLSLSVGAALGGSATSFVAAVNLGFVTPKGWVYEGQYDFSNKSITFGVKKLIKLQKE